MPNIKMSEIREKFPMYSDMSDDDLLIGLRKNYYTDIPMSKFTTMIDRDTERAAMNPTNDMGTVDRLRAGVGKAFTDVARGAGQLVGAVSREDVGEARKVDKALMDTTAGKVGDFAGNVALTVPTAFIPGVNTVAGAGAVGAGIGLLQPSESTSETLTNVALGGAGGAGGQYAGNKLGQYFQGAAQGSKDAATKTQSLNSLRDTVLKEGRDAGYVVPQSQVKPTFMSNRLESLGGKAAVKQEATARNQEVTNALTRKALGLPDDVPISAGALDKLRETAGKTYAEVADLSPIAKQDLEALKAARNEAQLYFTSYNRSANPEHLATAKAARALSEELEQSLESEALAVGRKDLIPQLREARKQIAKTYTVERALNKATGEVSAPVLGRLADKGKPLSDGLDTVGRFNQAFPQVTRPGAGNQAPGVSFFEPVTAGMAGAVGQMATGSPMGLLAAGVPLLRGPARSLALSPMMQGTPAYGGNRLAALLAAPGSQATNALARSLATSGALAAQ